MNSDSRAVSGVRSILSPTIDILLVGGLSLLFFVPLLLSSATDLLLVGVGVQAVLATLINMPHFMASYRIIYRSREMILRHKWASIYVPAILLVWVVAAVWTSQSSSILVVMLVTVSSSYLAWHYTGQVWGMMASYAYLEGISFEKRERFLIRTSLRILLVWHVAWFLYGGLRDPDAVRPLWLVISAGTVLAFVLGVVGLWMLYRRTGRLPPLRAVVAWLAIFSWYAVMARDRKAIFWIQIAHALQYLAFPIRVELNRTAAAVRRAAGHTAGRTAGSLSALGAHMALYGLGLLVTSYLVGEFVPAHAMDVVGNVLGEEPGKVVPVVILLLVNIHHYFTDGVIWKISDPEVRKDLFAHVTPLTAAGRESAGRSKSKGSRKRSWRG